MGSNQFQLFPALPDEEYRALKEDIAARGVQMPVVVDEAGNILDGFHRVRACEELGLRDYPVLQCPSLTHEQKIEQALNLNLLRRHLTPEQKLTLADRLLNEEGLSQHVVAEKLHMSLATVNRLKRSGVTDVTPEAVCAGCGADSEYVEEHGDIWECQKCGVWGAEPPLRSPEDEPPKRVTGKDGKSYPARRPAVMSASPREAAKVQEALRLLDDEDEELPEYSGSFVRPADVFKKANEVKRQRQVEELGHAPLLGAVSGQYSVILADPPWEYEGRTVDESRVIENHYPTMSLDEICCLPVENMARDDAVLFLWSSSPKLAEALTVMETWGFEYRTCMVWAKPGLGMGYWARQNHELLLIGRRGAMRPPLPENRPASLIEAPKGKHSEKPDVFYSVIERMFPGASRVELFARKARDGWARWGLEAPDGDAA